MHRINLKHLTLAASCREAGVAESPVLTPSTGLPVLMTERYGFSILSFAQSWLWARLAPSVGSWQAGTVPSSWPRLTRLMEGGGALTAYGPDGG